VPRRSKHSPRPAEFTPCLSLVLVDGAAIRQKIRREYEKVLRDLRRARQQIDQFRQVDLPRFTRWVNARFGALLTEMREASRRIAELELLFQNIAAEVLFTGTHPGCAYERILRRQKRAEAKASSSANGEGSGSSSDASDDPFAGHDRDPGDDPFRDGPRRSARKSPTSSHGEARLKELYRALVRRLHPDKQTHPTAQKLEWWHEAQAAYQEGDVDKLEAILTLCEIEEQGTTDKASLSILQRLTAQFSRTLRQLKTQLARHRKDLAWNFSRRTDHGQMEEDMRRQLVRELHFLRERLQSMEEELASWKREARHERAAHRRARLFGEPFESYF
jgi:hypothetical protein